MMIWCWCWRWNWFGGRPDGRGMLLVGGRYAAAPISKWLHHESGDHLEVADIHCRHGVTELQGRDPDHEVLEWDGAAFPLRFSVDPSRPAGDLEGQGIDRNGGKKIVEKLPAAAGLRGILSLARCRAPARSR